ncbi:SDR family NAD(P)-dependent oxidoreductase [Croceicoccus sp. BE223]|uniref:SDR family NAD(P)-dependent oxidoreductase n=1 Tax=Croceicoccus sp. BE223 TaxID=2817716 RepID=UPI00286254E5|nr:SDR family NAD(P)-dependent oxidoreductase [Croceicoccus sp. BE223]MDR7103650.1 NAD(P)-dependent dehydrogenase (short-subunit alcohol dehydrogenase family) [Croceicoccus sp. BE223]
MRFAGKSAIVTGAGKGIGAATARRLAAEGANVVCADRDEAALTEIMATISGDGGKAFAVTADVSKPEQVEAMVSAAISHFGALHLAVNNAGIGLPSAPTAEQSLENWNTMIAVNLSGVFHGLKYQIPAILASGGGAIVNVASMFAHHALRGHAGYTAAKFGVVGLTRTAAADYADKPIRINTVCPGVIDTPLARSGGDDTDAVTAMIPVGRLGKAAEVAGVIAFLLSDDASYVTASEYDVDGGILH